MKYQKGFIAPLLLALIALLLIGGGAYVYTQKKQENPPAVGNVALPQATSTILTANQTAPIAQIINSQTVGWKTYINTDYGFEMKYPREYEMDINMNTPLNDIIFDASFVHGDNYNFRIIKTKYENINDWYLNWREGFKEGPQQYEPGITINPSIDHTEDIEINGLHAKKVVIRGMPYTDTVIYFIKTNLYSFSYSGVTGRSRDIDKRYGNIPYYFERADYKKEVEQLRQKDLSLFNQIVSTLKFN